MMKKINIMFWVVWTITLLLSLVEAATYPGFLLKHLGIGINTFAIIAGVVTTLTILFRLIFKDRILHKNSKIVIIISAFLLSLYVVLKIVNRLTYSTYVFSNLHVWPDELLMPALISIFAVAVEWFPQVLIKKLLSIKSIIFIFAFIIVALNLRDIYRSQLQTFLFIVARPTASYDDKMRKLVGDIFYNYTLFVKQHTFIDVTLLTPPQAFPWPATGNEGYFRYFVIPRKIITGKESTPPSKEILDKVDYVLLNWGETERVESTYTHDWPKFDVKAEKIIFMNEDGSYGGEIKGDYHYKDYKDKRVWGLIVVKH